MSKYQIELTNEELDLYKIVALSIGKGVGTSCEEWKKITDAEYQLTLSLIERGAIPAQRIQYLYEPNLNIGTKYSRIEVFHNNGTKGRDVFRHPHFIPYLLYIINGPKLPESTLRNFESFVSTNPVNETEDVRIARDLAKQEVRANQLDPKTACEEFFKLALETGLGPIFARVLRDTVRSMRVHY